MKMHACGQLNGHNYLVSRIRKTCDKHNVSFLKYVFNENYASHVRQNMLRMSHDGLSDSVRQCIISHDPYDRVLLRMLLKAFNCTLRFEGNKYIIIIIIIISSHMPIICKCN